MNKITTLIGITALCFSSLTLGASSTGKGTNPNGKPFLEIQGQIFEVEGEVSTLKDQVDALIGQVDSMEARMQAADDTIVNLTNLNATLQTQIDANSDDIDSLYYQIQSLESENTDLQNQIDSFGDSSGELQAQVTANNTQISQLTQSINDLGSNLQNQIENNTNLIGVLQNEIADISQLLQTKQDIIEGVCPEGTAVVSVGEDSTLVCREIQNTSQSVYIETWWKSTYIATPQGVSTNIDLYCPEGFNAKDVGYLVGKEVDVTYLNTFTSSVRVQVYNNATYPYWSYAFARCEKLVVQ